MGEVERKKREGEGQEGKSGRICVIYNDAGYTRVCEGEEGGRESGCSEFGKASGDSHYLLTLPTYPWAMHGCGKSRSSV